MLTLIVKSNIWQFCEVLR